MVTIACIGIAVKDHVWRVDHPISSGEKHRAVSMETVTGGPAANAALAITALGGASRLLAKLGDDAAGDEVLADLKERGVDVSGVRRALGVPSPVSSVAVDPLGERTIVNYTDHRLIDAHETVNPSDLEDVDLVLTDLRWPDGARSAIEVATSLGIPSVVDYDLTSVYAPELFIASASHVVFSRTAISQLVGTTDVHLALSKVADTTDAFVGVTLGGDGFAWYENGAIRSFPANRVEVVDTLGAGDVFHGAFGLALAQKRSLPEIVRFASAAAALSCTRRSGSTTMPTHTEVETFLEAQP